MGRRGRPTVGEEKKASIRKLNALGYNDCKIAKMIGLSQVTVYRYRTQMRIPRVVRIKPEPGKKNYLWSRAEITEFIQEYVRQNKSKVQS